MRSSSRAERLERALAVAACQPGQRGARRRLQPVRRREDQRIERDRQQRAGEDQVAALGRQQAERDAEPGEDERELADLRQAGRDGQRRCRPDSPAAARWRTRPATCRPGSAPAPPAPPGLAHQDRRIEQHADRDEEQHREGILQRQRSAAAWWLRSDSLSTTPAKKAPSANETPKTCAEPKAMPSASASTERVNSSREPVRATWVSNHGTTRGPSRMAIATKAATLSERDGELQREPRIARRVARRGLGLPPSTSANAGSSTSASTIARSSTISQPTAMRPFGVSTRLRSSSARSSTTVLATDRPRPNTRPAPRLQPHSQASADAEQRWRPRSGRRRRASRCRAPPAGRTPRNAGRRRTSAG